VVGCAFFMEGLDSTMIAVAIPDMAKGLGESPLRLNLVITTYLLSLAVFIPVSGWIADRLGTRVVFCVAISIFAAGSALCGFSTSLPMMLVMRVLQGFGGAMMTPVGRLILLRSFPRSGLVSAMNWMTIPAMIGPTVGPIVGGFLTTYLSWRAIFYLNLPIGIAGVVLALWLIEDFRAPAPTRFDLRGFFIAGLGLALLELAIENVGRPMIPGPLGAVFFAAALAILLFYRWHAGRREDPILDLRLLRIRTFRIGTVTGSICRMGLDAVPFLLPLMFQVGFGFSPLQSGLLSCGRFRGPFCASSGSVGCSPAPPVSRRR
jgi:EmrB/QacA subfamily drug resistance transporter